MSTRHRPRLNLGAVPPTPDSVVAGSQVTMVHNPLFDASASAGAGELKTRLDAGPFYGFSEVGISGSGFSQQYVEGVNFGKLGSAEIGQSDYIGKGGVGSSSFRSEMVAGHQIFAESSGVKIDSKGINFNEHLEIGGHKIIDADLSTASCCAPIGQFFSWAFEGLGHGIKALGSKGGAALSAAGKFLKDLPWAEIGKDLAELAKGILSLLKK